MAELRPPIGLGGRGALGERIAQLAAGGPRERHLTLIGMLSPLCAAGGGGNRGPRERHRRELSFRSQAPELAWSCDPRATPVRVGGALLAGTAACAPPAASAVRPSRRQPIDRPREPFVCGAVSRRAFARR